MARGRGGWGHAWWGVRGRGCAWQGCVHGRGVCVAGGACMAGGAGMHGRGAWGACMARGCMAGGVRATADTTGYGQ